MTSDFSNRCLRVTTAGFCYYRLRKPEYSAAEQAQIEAKVQNHLAAGRDVFLYYKHEDTPEGALNAEKLLASAAPKTA